MYLSGSCKSNLLAAPPNVCGRGFDHAPPVLDVHARLSQTLLTSMHRRPGVYGNRLGSLVAVGSQS